MTLLYDKTVGGWWLVSNSMSTICRVIVGHGMSAEPRQDV